MPAIDAATIRELITVDGELFVPERITKAIGHSVVSEVTDISNKIDQLVAIYKQYIKYDGPTPVTYSDEITIDAYAINYLPRSTLIPKLLFLSLAYHPAFQTIKNEINVLDLGSGTGGVVLGLLDLFNHDPLSAIKANILSFERSRLALDRQKELLTQTNYQHCNIWFICDDVADTRVYGKSLLKMAPYDYIIAANLFAEMSPNDIKLVLAQLPNIMGPNAVLLVAEPPRAYVDKLKVDISDTLRSLGLFQYYPCPPKYECPKPKCKWVWFDFEFNCPSIEVNGEIFEITKPLTTTWSIFCRSEHSIYDFIQDMHASLTWGVAVPIGKEFDIKEKLDYSICTAGGPRKVTHTRKKALFRNRTEVILRGSILGFNDDYSEVLAWHPLYGLELQK